MPEIVRGEAAADGFRGYPSLRPRKPQSGEGSQLIEFLYGICFPDRRLAGPTDAPEERTPQKKQKESAKSLQSRINGKLLALSNKVQIILIFSPMA